MKITFFIPLFLSVTFLSYSQKIYVHPSIGFLYTGLTNYGNASNLESDFKSPIPTIAEYLGFEIAYKPINTRIAHKLNLQRTIIGTTAQISSFGKLGYQGMRYREYSAIEQVLLGYSVHFNKKSGHAVFKK